MNNETNLEVLAKKYNVDKLDHGFIDIYEKFFEYKRNSIKKILEIGVYKGDSLRMWADYFPNAQIHGWDLKTYSFNQFGERINTFVVNQEDRVSIQNNIKIDYDIIIDDGCHTMCAQQISLAVLWKHLSYGGIYIIEDLHTSLPHNPYEWKGGKCLPDFSNSSLRMLQNLQTTGKVYSIYMINSERQKIEKECSVCRVYDTKNDERHITSVLLKNKSL
jgi:hypothetical protein